MAVYADGYRQIPLLGVVDYVDSYGQEKAVPLAVVNEAPRRVSPPYLSSFMVHRLSPIRFL